MPEATAVLSAALASDGYRVRKLVPGKELRQVRPDHFEVDFSSPSGLAELHERLSNGKPVGAVVNLLGLCEPFCNADGDQAQDALAISLGLFNVFKEFEPDLRQSAESGGGWIMNVTSINGKFGLDCDKPLPIAAAGTIGLVKSFRRECPTLTVKIVDVDPSAKPDLLASRILQEFAAGGDVLEVGLTQTKRFRLALKDDPVTDADLHPLPIGSDSVILVTGGAYGITADITRKLATFKPTLILVGRSPAPSAEPAETAGLAAAELRRHLIEQNRSASTKKLPAEIERSVNRLLKDRQIRANLDTFQKLGANVEYHAVDVRNPQQFGNLIDSVYTRFGRLDGVVHGAGVIDDKRVRDKSPESFANVFGTKVESAIILSKKLRPEQLKFLIFFSSVVGRFGNAGQTDYSAANEFLNKLACELDRKWPARVVSINWGPWDAGMVSDQLRSLYHSRGVHLIPIEEGVRCLESELRLNGRGRSEVVISRSIDQIANMGMES